MSICPMTLRTSKLRPSILFLLLCTCSASALPAAPPGVRQMRCEYLENPEGIDAAQPRLSWVVEADERGWKQSAYRIRVASTSERLASSEADLWDSGRVASDQTVHVRYEGNALRSRQRCFWQVEVWDAGGNSSVVSDVARWSMGLLEPSDWQAKYISYRDETPVFNDRDQLFLPAAHQYRKTFRAPAKIRRATWYATALGIYELSINGQRVGDAYFAPGWTDYRQRAYYNTYDVTSLLTEGENALGAYVADGWYSGYLGFGLLTGIGTEQIGRYTYGKTPSWMGQLEIEYEDGSRAVVVTDSSWKVSGDGPIQEADFLMGEFYDARREQPGWDQPGFADDDWPTAILATDNGHPEADFYEFRNAEPGGQPEIKSKNVDLGFRRPPRLESFPGVPVRAIEEIRPVAMTSPADGVYIFNLGQNFAGVVRLRVRGQAGTTIRLRYGEMLHPDGRLMTENLRKARAHDVYILKGDPEGETFTPRFTFHGFQYVEVSGFPGVPTPEAITGIVLHSDTPRTSDFRCSDPMVNRLFQNVVWTQRANFIDLPTDCPQRDERFGWTGDAQAYVRTATYNADVAAFYTKWLRELMESQRPSGTFPGYAPYPFQHGWDFGTAWCDAGVICPWTIYHVYGDRQVIEQCWEPMTRFMQWRRNTSQDSLGVVHGNDWGDWLAVNERTPLDYIDTIFFAYSSRLMAEMAEATDRQEEAEEYRQLYRQIATAFAKKYVHRDGTLAIDTQTAYALALFADLIPPELRQAAGDHLAQKIRDNENRMATGFLGTRPLLPVLSAVGHHDLAVRLLQSREFPSWGYEIEQGATTIWERWDSYTKEDGFGRHNASMNSFSHYAFGAVCEWMFSTLAGIEPQSPGFQQIRIHPRPPAPDSNPQHPAIHWVQAHYDSIHGRVGVAWAQDNGRFRLDVEIPANTSARVILPASRDATIQESGQALSMVEGIEVMRRADQQAELSIGSGTYQFVVQPADAPHQDR